MQAGRLRSQALLKIMKKISITFLMGFALAITAIAQSTKAAHTPDKGSAERKAILDVLRDSYKKDSGQTVTYQVHYIKVHNGWAWVDTTPLDDKNKPVAEGGPQLLHFENDKWTIIDLSKVPEDPNDPLGIEDASPGFIKNLRKLYPQVPLDIFPKHGK